MLENKAATARDHLGKCCWGRLFWEYKDKKLRSWKTPLILRG
jgi:hypothetical protein